MESLRPQMRTAPLKLLHHRNTQEHTGSLRPQMRTAPLKPGCAPSMRSGIVSLRPQMRTAPLKPRCVVWAVGQRSWSPSSDEDGSIEAPQTLSSEPIRRRSPSSDEDGSIEAFCAGSRQHINPGLRPQMRTAPLKPPFSRTTPCTPSSLRPQMRTAPLKPSCQIVYAMSSACLRPQMRTAPLKHANRHHTGKQPIGSPSSDEDGSIEASRKAS